MTATRLLVLGLTVVATTCGAGQAAPSEYDPFSTLRHATRAERRATHPIAQTVIGAFRSGRMATLCARFSPAEIKRSYGSLTRCRQLLSGSTYRCSERCSFRVVSVETAYLTARDKVQGRKTLLWLYAVNNPARTGNGELEIRCRQEVGRWTLQDIVEAWSG